MNSATFIDRQIQLVLQPGLGTICTEIGAPGAVETSEGIVQCGTIEAIDEDTVALRLSKPKGPGQAGPFVPGDEVATFPRSTMRPAQVVWITGLDKHITVLGATVEQVAQALRRATSNDQHANPGPHHGPRSQPMGHDAAFTRCLCQPSGRAWR